MFRSDGERRSFSIMRDMTVIGRREDCDLRIPLSDVSRKHCRLVRDGETLRLEDLGSSNGTYCNGERVQEAVLAPGDTLQVGPVQFVLQIDGQPADDELAPSEGAAVAESPYEASDSATIDDEPVSTYEELPATLEPEENPSHSSGAHELSEHATFDEPVANAEDAPAPPVRRQPPSPPPIPVPPAPVAAKSNGAHSAPPALESDAATPFQELDDAEVSSEDEDFFIVDEPNTSSQSGEIQIDMDSPPA
jgi:hypothetical protein